MWPMPAVLAATALKHGSQLAWKNSANPVSSRLITVTAPETRNAYLGAGKSTWSCDLVGRSEHPWPGLATAVDGVRAAVDSARVTVDGTQQRV
jgi:hypothetical protein